MANTSDTSIKAPHPLKNIGVWTIIVFCLLFVTLGIALTVYEAFKQPPDFSDQTVWYRTQAEVSHVSSSHTKRTSYTVTFRFIPENANKTIEASLDVDYQIYQRLKNKPQTTTIFHKKKDPQSIGIPSNTAQENRKLELILSGILFVLMLNIVGVTYFIRKKRTTSLG